MPKLLQINITANWGSHGRIAEQIGNMAIAQGWESNIAYGRWCNSSLSYLYHIGNRLDEYVHALSTRILDNQGLMSRHATRNLIRYIKEIQPDIIHLHNIHGYYLNYPILFKFLKEYNHPVVWTLHDCWAFTGHCPYFELANCYRWRKGCHDCPNRKQYPASYLFDRSEKNYFEKKYWFTFPNNITLVPVSNWLGNYLKESFLNKYPIHCIHNGVDIKAFRPRANARKIINEKYELHGKHLIIGVASVWDERKGLQDFFKLRTALPLEYDLLLVGLSQKQISDLPSGIKGIKRTNGVDELSAIYSAADVFFNPTMEETLSMVNLEAQSCGTMVVSYKTGGCPETISDGNTGFIVNQKDITTACKRIQDICESGMPNSTENCRQHIVNNFQKENRYLDYIKLYGKVL